MRRLLTWIVILTCGASLLLIGVRATHPDLSPTACIQLLSPTTGDVLTLNATTGVALPDARSDFPLPLPPVPHYFDDPISPDHTHIIDTRSRTTNLSLGIRSTTYRRPLTDTTSLEHFRWSPDSQHVAFTENRGWKIGEPLVSVSIVEVASGLIKRHAVAGKLGKDWSSLEDLGALVWSPDATLLAFHTNGEQLGGKLWLWPDQADQPLFTPLPDQTIEYITWSPDSQAILVFTRNLNTRDQHFLFVFQRDGQLRTHTSIMWSFNPVESEEKSLRWSPDGQYFYLLSEASYLSSIDVFSVTGDRMLPEPLRIYPFALGWLNLPHTLLYLMRDENFQTLYRLDADTGQSTVLIDAIPTDDWPILSPDQSMLAVVSRRDPDHLPDHFTAYSIAMDLSQTLMPFGEVTSQTGVSLHWSPDSQSLLMVATHQTFSMLTWWRRDTGDLHEFQFAQRGAPPSGVDWLTDDIILFSNYAGNELTQWRLDTHSNTVIPLFSFPAGTDYYIHWHDASHIAIGVKQMLTVYRLSDASSLFPHTTPARGQATPFLEPHERAMLLFLDPLYEVTNSNVRQLTTASLSLTTPTSSQLLANTDDLTEPAWSSDGETFAFGVIEPPNTGWTVKIMSRDGKLLQSFILPPQTTTTPYRQARWTDCG